MTPPAAAAAVTGLPMALGLAGLATTSAGITLAGLQGRNAAYCYPQLALSAGVFYAGLAELGAAVWWMADTRRRTAVGKKILCGSLVPLAAAAGLAAAKLIFWPGCF